MNSFNEQFKEFAREHKIHYNDIKLYFKAFTHTSYANEHRVESNERLEFVGDAILDFLVGEYLYKTYPQMVEGNLSKLRAKYVCEDANMQYSIKLGLDKLILLGKGEEEQGGRKKETVLGDLFEAFLGALYLDNNRLDDVLKILETYVFPNIEVSNDYHKDYKSTLQELIQSENRKSVVYKVIKEEGPAHDKTFTVAVYFEATKLGEGVGKNKKEAEQNAAKFALAKLAR